MCVSHVRCGVFTEGQAAQGRQPRTADGCPVRQTGVRRLLFRLGRWAVFMARPTGSVVCRKQATHTCVSPGVRVRRNGCVRQDPSWPQTNVLIATFISSVKTSEVGTARSKGRSSIVPSAGETGLLIPWPSTAARSSNPGSAVNVLGCDPQSAVSEAIAHGYGVGENPAPWGLQSAAPGIITAPRAHNKWLVGRGDVCVLFFHWHSCAVHKHKLSLPVFI